MKRILIVDDDRTLRKILKRHLENQGYLVEAVPSAVEALDLFEIEPPDLVVSDVMMPEMDGFEFCRRLRSHPSGKLLPFIFLSSKGELDDRIEGHSRGADDYLIKPFEPLELVAKIEAQLERSRRINAEMIRLMQQVAAAGMAPYPAAPMKGEDGGEGAIGGSPLRAESLPLTPAEARVFLEVIQGYTNKQIAANLYISPRTVQTHLRHILSKLKLENRSQVIRYAFENGYRPHPEE